ncbi:MAG: hypothetical protein RMN25_09840 [Anaerolineae bacterium]|nr:hypothetical protein [Thermoflexales bacterium]MDW8408069.1 hypothetical protein [Anaerolineae bacterium]
MNKELIDWLVERGWSIAQLLDQRREEIVARVTARFYAHFPTLCLDTFRPDAVQFQALVFQQTPLRLHRHVQLVLRARSFRSMDWEYRWAVGLLAGYGVHRHHLLRAAHWYFDVGSSVIGACPADRKGLLVLEAAVLNLIEESVLHLK